MKNAPLSQSVFPRLNRSLRVQNGDRNRALHEASAYAGNDIPHIEVERHRSTREDSHVAALANRESAAGRTAVRNSRGGAKRQRLLGAVGGRPRQRRGLSASDRRIARYDRARRSSCQGLPNSRDRQERADSDRNEFLFHRDIQLNSKSTFLIKYTSDIAC